MATTAIDLVSDQDENNEGTTAATAIDLVSGEDDNTAMTADDRMDTTYNFEPGQDHTEEENGGDSTSTPGLPSNVTADNNAPSIRKRKRKAVDKSQAAAPSNPESRDTNSPDSGPSRVKGSAELLRSATFVTQSYKESQSIYPSSEMFKQLKAKNGDTVGATDHPQTFLGSLEVQGLLPLLDDLVSPLRQTHFDPSEDTTRIDKKIRSGFKLSQANDDEDDEDTDIRPRRLGGHDDVNKLIKFTGLDSNLEPMSNIDDIFADLTRRACEIGFSDFTRAIGSGKLKVATLCSGTESPILALQMIIDSEHSPASLRSMR